MFGVGFQRSECRRSVGPIGQQRSNPGKLRGKGRAPGKRVAQLGEPQYEGDGFYARIGPGGLLCLQRIEAGRKRGQRFPQRRKLGGQRFAGLVVRHRAA